MEGKKVFDALLGFSFILGPGGPLVGRDVGHLWMSHPRCMTPSVAPERVEVTGEVFESFGRFLNFVEPPFFLEPSWDLQVILSPNPSRHNTHVTL